MKLSGPSCVQWQRNSTAMRAQGGLRGEAFVYTKSTTLLPSSVRGTTWPGCVHTSDWLPTVIEGIFGLKLDHADEFAAAGSDGASVRPLDGFNVWSAIASGGASPRTEVISQVSNSFFNTSSEGRGGKRKCPQLACPSKMRNVMYSHCSPR
eukprot:SAG31_NODE_5309_length_2619_cov_1.517857_2_plen_151_part_00